MNDSGRINLHIYPSPFRNESRMLKETKSLADAGFFDQIYIVAMWEEGLPEHEQLDQWRQVWRVRPRTGGQRSSLPVKILRYLEWQAKILWRFRARQVTFVNCHSLPVLPLGLVFKLFFRSRLVYDTHELETENPRSAGIRKTLSKLVERICISFVDAVVTVNQSIAHWYRQEYGLKNVHTVRNIPYQLDGGEIDEASLLKREFGILDEQILFLYHGGLGHGRGIGVLLDVFAKVDRSKHVVFMGYGEEWEKVIQKYERTCRNIHFRDAVSPQDVCKYVSGADVGLSLIENASLSYYLSLPNKIFECIMSGIPVIASDFPEMKQVIDENKCGWTVSPDYDIVLDLVKRITWNDICEKRKNVLDYRKTIGWHKEEQVMLQVYYDLCERGVAEAQK